MILRGYKHYKIKKKCQRKLKTGCLGSILGIIQIGQINYNWWDFCHFNWLKLLIVWGLQQPFLNNQFFLVEITESN